MRPDWRLRCIAKTVSHFFPGARFDMRERDWSDHFEIRILIDVRELVMDPTYGAIERDRERLIQEQEQ